MVPAKRPRRQGALRQRPEQARPQGRRHAREAQEPGDGSLWKPVDPFRRDVRALIETREVHHGPLMQGYNRLEALLARHWPELSSVVNIYETTSLWRFLLEMPDPREIAARSREAG